ncbi:MAG: HD domain-containing protein [Deltaproteobacteria bacterium]|nr:HD domain-containing protein [Deltaproteobacteria bacterium]
MIDAAGNNMMPLDDFVKWALNYMNENYYFLGEHSTRVAAVTGAILDKLGINGEDKKLMKYASLLHDIGKLSIPKEILLAPRELTDKEFELVKDHPVIGYKKLAHIKSLKNINPIILYHHYRNGFGYPQKLENVPMPASILIDVLTVVDSYSAIKEKRIYNVWNLEHMDVIKILKNEDDPKNKGINQEIVDILSKINTTL